MFPDFLPYMGNIPQSVPAVHKERVHSHSPSHSRVVFLDILRAADTMDNFPTALFDSYEQDFRQIIDSVRSELDIEGKEERGGSCAVMY